MSGVLILIADSFMPLLLFAAEQPTDVDAGASNDHPLLRAVIGLVYAGLVVISFGICCCLYRIIRGPCLADRVLAGDALAMQVVGLVVLLGISMRTTIYFDAALVVGIIGFVSTVAFAQYIHARAEEGIEP